jgi:hypothetical protein
MIVVPGKFIYAGSPRSGSHFIYSVLEKHFPDAERWPEHHALIPDVLNAKRMGGGLPVYTVVRSPLKQIFSFYWNSLFKYPDRIVTTTFAEFIEGRKPPNVPYQKALNYPPGALAIYRDVADKFFPFEKDFSRLFAFLGVDQTYGVAPSRIPTPEYLDAQTKITEIDKNLVRKYFKKDWDLYESSRA